MKIKKNTFSTLVLELFSPSIANWEIENPKKSKNRLPLMPREASRKGFNKIRLKQETVVTSVNFIRMLTTPENSLKIGGGLIRFFFVST
jgi:hypothetical protein